MLVGVNFSVLAETSIDNLGKRREMQRGIAKKLINRKNLIARSLVKFYFISQESICNGLAS